MKYNHALFLNPYIETNTSNNMPDNIPLVVGGYKATEKVEEIFESCPKVDIIVRGEGEDTIKEILKGVPFENILGISYRAEEICDLIIERKIKKLFIAQARLEIAKYPTLLEKMVKAGFKILLIGIESPHDHILTQLDKGFDAKTIRESFAVLTKYPI